MHEPRIAGGLVAAGPDPGGPDHGLGAVELAVDRRLAADRVDDGKRLRAFFNDEQMLRVQLCSQGECCERDEGNSRLRYMFRGHGGKDLLQEVKAIYERDFRTH